jgi:cytochrome P450
MPLPILGHWIQILRGGYRSDVANKDKYGKIFGQYEGWRPSIVVCDPKILGECTIKKFSDFPCRIIPFPVSHEVEKAVTTQIGADWKRQRNIMTRAFSAAKMRKLAELINGCARQFTDVLNVSCSNNEEIECRKVCGEFVMRVVATSLFGVDVSHPEELQKFARYAIKMGATLDIKNPVMFLSLLSSKITYLFKASGYKYKRRGPVAAECFDFFERTMIALKKAREQLTEDQKPNDLLQLLLDGHKTDKAVVDDAVQTSAFDETNVSMSVVKDVGKDQEKEGFSTHEIVSNAIIFFSAGYITTTAAMSWMMMLLATNPEVQERLHEEIEEVWPGDAKKNLSYDQVAKMTYLDQVFCETLRLYPSTQRMDRISTRDTSLGGKFVPKGMQINLSIWSIHHDPDYWEDPYTFNPDRFGPENKDKIQPHTYIPFGSGPRNCIGMRLATLEAKIAISHILKKFRIEACARTEEAKVMRNQVHTAPSGGVHVKLSYRD